MIIRARASVLVINITIGLGKKIHLYDNATFLLLLLWDSNYMDSTGKSFTIQMCEKVSHK